MFKILKAVFTFFCSIFQSERRLVLENLALRHQLAVFQSSKVRPKLSNCDRNFWIFLSRLYRDWKRALVIVRPETVVAWHRKGYATFWGRKTGKKKPGRYPISVKLRALVRRMARENDWGAPRIHGELLMLGYTISERTVSKYMPQYKAPPSQKWSTFIKNHMDSTVAVDFFTVPTLFFRNIYVFVVISHGSREILHFNSSERPNVEWVKRQMRHVFPGGHDYKFLVRDNDAMFQKDFSEFLKDLEVADKNTRVRSPWQNGFCERVIGSIKRELFEKIIPINEKHLRKLMTVCVDYYNKDRTHMGTGKETPSGRERESGRGKIFSVERVGGLHRRYYLDEESKAS